ncbi:15348_t:CDS:2 [Acaulospora colombiana]|uniref:15348_t:CDS:1 n=1 Tax=Acaulospora colombiana TaxID=27376 RepID=A0ACA9P734_9GLOM|nr:15348_t:CDS:2 [Acaulospora colombiana]
MTESAVQRTPIEVWTLILYHAIATPLLPFVDESHNHLSTSIIQTIDLFSDACPAYKTCRGTEKTIKIGYPSKGISALKGVERLEFARDCYCTDFKFLDDTENDLEDDIGCLVEYISPRGEAEVPWWRNIEDEMTRQLIRQVRIFSSYEHEFYTKKILGLMPQLQALSLRSSQRSEPLTSLLSLLPPESHITHLEICGIPWMEFTSYFSKGRCNLPCLRYLHLAFDFRSLWDTNNTKYTGEWAAFQLESLIITGSLGVDAEYLDPFLSVWGKTIREYVDDSHSPHGLTKAASAPNGIPPFHHFPQLSLYGTRLETIITGLDTQNQSQKVSTPYPTRNPRTFLLKIRYTGLECDPEEAALRFIAYVQEYGFVEVVLNKSWTYLRKMWDFHKPSEPLSEGAQWNKTFFQTLLREGLNVMDINFISIGDGRSRMLWE